jgi:hypothetical protein
MGMAMGAARDVSAYGRNDREVALPQLSSELRSNAATRSRILNRSSPTHHLPVSRFEALPMAQQLSLRLRRRTVKFQPQLARLEDRVVLSGMVENVPLSHAAVHAAAPHAQIQASAVKTAARLPNFSVAQERSFLPGKWRVVYDASSVFGPGAREAQEITFTGPRGTPTFISTTGLWEQGLVGPAYYQFSSWGTYRFLSKTLVRLNITGGSPTEYLNNGIIVPGGQFVGVQFLSKNQFRSSGQTYFRVPLNSTIFNP